MVIHAAQVSLPNASAAIFPGADTDTLRAKWRVDGCHFPASHDKRKEGPAVTFAGKTASASASPWCHMTWVGHRSVLRRRSSASASRWLYCPLGAHSKTLAPPTAIGHNTIDDANPAATRRSPSGHHGLPSLPVAPPVAQTAPVAFLSITSETYDANRKALNVFFSASRGG